GQNDFTLKGELSMPDGNGGSEESEVTLVSSGSVAVSAENVDGNKKFSFSSDITIKQLSYMNYTSPDASVALKDLNISGNVVLENNKLTFSGKNEGENFKVSGELYNVTDGK